jgi:5-methylcytosine-specific restriction endonuclease McrA
VRFLKGESDSLRRTCARENRDGLLERATHRAKRQIAELVAEIAPRPDVPVAVRKLPERRMLSTAGHLVVPNHGEGPMLELSPDPRLVLRPDGVASPGPGAPRDEAAVSYDALRTDAPAVGASSSVSQPVVPASSITPPVVPASSITPPVVQPLAPGRYKVQFTASAEFHHKLERLGVLMGSRGPDGDLAAVIEQAVTEKLERLEARHFARTKVPRKGLPETETEAKLHWSPSSRHIPAAIRRAVSERDGGRCRYVDEKGRRCPEQNRLEYHHRHPFGVGGDHSVANVQLMCRGHNAYLAECDYGKEAMARHRRLGLQGSQTTAG